MKETPTKKSYSHTKINDFPLVAGQEKNKKNRKKNRGNELCGIFQNKTQNFHY